MKIKYFIALIGAIVSIVAIPVMLVSASPTSTGPNFGTLLLFGGFILMVVGMLLPEKKKDLRPSVAQPKPVTLSSPKPPSPQPKQATSSVPPPYSQNSKERAIAYCKEGDRLYEQGRTSEALRAFDDALKYDASSLDALEGKMMSLGVLGKNEQAIEIAKRVLTLDSNSRPAWRCIAAVSWERRNKEVAWEAVNRLLSNDSKDESALLIKSALLEEDGRIREALAVVNLAVEENPNDETLIEYRDALQQRIHEERVEKTVKSIKVAGEIAANMGKIVAQDLFMPNCLNLKCGAKLAPGQKICHVCGRPR